MKNVNIAKNTTEFLDTVSSAIVKTMNTTEIGQELTEKLLDMKLAENPNMTKEEWNIVKQQFHKGNAAGNAGTRRAHL